jgi:hypothetical protein
MTLLVTSTEVLDLKTVDARQNILNVTRYGATLPEGIERYWASWCRHCSVYSVNGIQSSESVSQILSDTVVPCNCSVLLFRPERIPMSTETGAFWNK